MKFVPSWMRRVITTLTLLVACSAYAAETVKALSPLDQNALLEIAANLRDAIVHKDVARILVYVSHSTGLGCTDDSIPYRSVKKYLYNKTSHLYISLFDSSQFSERCGDNYPPEFPAISDLEFFTADKNITIEIIPLGKNRAQVIFRSQVKGHYQREWDFLKDGNQWKLVYGFIVGRCSCG